jgi:hypothetical protein
VSPSSQELVEAIEDMSGKRFIKSTIYGNGHSGVAAAIAISEWKPSIKHKAYF